MARKLLEGMDRVMKNLNEQTVAIKGRTLHGMIRAAIMVQRGMDKSPPLVPVGETGNLRSSFFIVTSRGEISSGDSPVFKDDKEGKLSARHNSIIQKAKSMSFKQPTVIMGFTANYAMWTHESIGRTYQRPGAGPRYFQASIRRNMPAMLKIMRDTAKI